jgi:hypothetical protein
MGNLDTPDLCARLDRLRDLCDRLEEAQDDRRRYQQLVAKIRAEATAFQEAICNYQDKPSVSEVRG